MHTPEQHNGPLHGCAFVGTLALTACLFIGVLYLTDETEASHVPPLKEMMTIEASLARKAEKKVQPQKELKAPEPPPKPEGVSRDENKPPPPKKEDKPEEKKPPRPVKKDDKPVDISKFKHASDDEQQPGSKPTTDIGQFDGSEKGFAPINAGNPYWQHLVADFHQVWEIPQISKVNGAAVGCFHIDADGRIPATRFDAPSGDETLDDSVQRAMKATQKMRNDKPQPVPTEQLGVIKKWVCFRFNPNQ
jgi:outer membrane biosynthesis protein TonB